MLELTPKDPAESVPVAFDFSEYAASITSATVSVAVREGSDPEAAAMLDGAYQIQGALVLQKISNGVPGTRYTIRTEAVTPQGKFVLVGLLPVETAENS